MTHEEVNSGGASDDTTMTHYIDGVTVNDERWRGVLEQAMNQPHSRDLPTPPGLPDGSFCKRQRARGDGTQIITLYHRHKRHGKQREIAIGAWPADGQRTSNRGVIPVGRVIERSDGYRVRVEEYPPGLPWPVLIMG